MVAPSHAEIKAFIQRALAEDIGSGDVTTQSIVPADHRSRARFAAREPLVIAGLPLALAAFRELDPDVHFASQRNDGDALAAGEILFAVEGPSRALLTAERVALNCVQRLSGIATLTAAFVEAIHHTSTRILDTRKTTPGWRTFEKYAVTCGRGTNHRRGLDDLILIKDNHLAALADASPNAVAVAISRARHRFPYLKIEVEADHLDQVRQAVDAGADIVLLDNMSLDQLRQAVAICRGRTLTEASGGVRLDTVRAIAETGVDFVSVGALTHSAPAVDIGLDFFTP